ncbi:superoxide dismutase family protein [Photobacterium leiognathi]|uniref:Superoxide dismutase [Cu-Zn] n=2 Tax=Photobacterium leiognathi TaxID=553611 RepID=A0ABX5G9F9_PHOLE|nr:superoxide dismutase family protein [Photobacterium leiognathi]AAC24761.1 Cu/Zn superoxide dismutase [Photobacterium leiognathi]KJF85391.1 superoxide dismutase [Photobacterium leiognathi]PSV74886.1 superoxide dismutase [Photobacterium leiognathi]
MKISKILLCLSLLTSCQTFADQLDINIKDLKTGKSIGYVNVKENVYGLIFTPHLKDLKPGIHGFHIHQNGSCQAIEKNGNVILGGAAGGHYDPFNTHKHGFPWGRDNHRGDLPALYVNNDGIANMPVIAQRLTLDELKGHAIMIHQNGDNYSDSPKPLGGGGPREACGVIK